MANEIRIQSSLAIRNGNFDGAWSATFQADQSGTGGGNPGTVDLTTTEAEITFGDIDNEGWCWIKNIGDTNTAQVGFSSSFTSGMQIAPGETAGPFRLIQSSELHAKSITGPTSIFVIILEH